jgi:hypothetical protein
MDGADNFVTYLFDSGGSKSLTMIYIRLPCYVHRNLDTYNADLCLRGQTKLKTTIAREKHRKAIGMSNFL